MSIASSKLSLTLKDAQKKHTNGQPAPIHKRDTSTKNIKVINKNVPQRPKTSQQVLKEKAEIVEKTQDSSLNFSEAGDQSILSQNQKEVNTSKQNMGLSIGKGVSMNK